MQPAQIRRRSSMTAGNRKGGWKVGFRKPPVHSRFKPGQSGNPAGRPKGTCNFKSDVRDTLQSVVKINDKGAPSFFFMIRRAPMRTLFPYTSVTAPTGR